MSTSCPGTTGFALMAHSEGTQDPSPPGWEGSSRAFIDQKALFEFSYKIKKDVNETAEPKGTFLLPLGP